MAAPAGMLPIVTRSWEPIPRAGFFWGLTMSRSFFVGSWYFRWHIPAAALTAVDINTVHDDTGDNGLTARPYCALPRYCCTAVSTAVASHDTECEFQGDESQVAG